MAPATVRDRPDDFELSLASANDVDILLALGLAPEPTVLEQAGEIAEAFLDVAFASAEEDDGHLPLPSRRARCELRGASAEVAAECRRHQTREAVDRCGFAGSVAGATHIGWS